MNQELINTVIYKMTGCLNNEQLMKLKEVLEESTQEENRVDESPELLERFIATKKLEGRSDKTLTYYKKTVERMLKTINVNVKAITTDDLRKYLSDY